MYFLRSSRLEVFYEKGVLKKLTGKHLFQSPFLNKVTGLRPEIFKNTFFCTTPLVAASGDLQPRTTTLLVFFLL